MISLKEKLHLYRLMKKLRKLKGEYEADIKKAKKDGKDRDYIKGIIAEMYGCCQYDEFEIEEIITRELIRKARKYYIELPDRKDEKIWENNFGSYILTDHGKSIISKQIKAHQREDYEFVIKISAVLIGLIGALTGLMAVMNR